MGDQRVPVHRGCQHANSVAQTTSRGAQDVPSRPLGVCGAQLSGPMDKNDDVVVVARVRLSLADGSNEEWMVPMELTDDALSYHAAIYPPEGAVVVAWTL